ncbi:MAG: hypothetical protein V4628_09030 [Pseudomonadota bacterium]
MTTTIDNLRVDHQVTILRDFTDAAGVSLCAGESAIVRRLSFDQIRLEIHIELESNAGKAVQKIALLFSATAQSGPRNGHMREYFELGNYAPVPGTEPVRRAVETQRINVPPPVVATVQESNSDWWRAAHNTDGPDRLEALENAMLKATPVVGVCGSIAEMYAQRMRAFRSAGNETRAIAAFKLAIDWMTTNASQATSGGEGTALSRERKLFHAALVREFGYDPTRENDPLFINNPAKDNSR